MIIIPINIGNQHWICGAINLMHKRIEVYDSLGSDIPNRSVVQVLRDWVDGEHRIHFDGKPADFTEWDTYIPKVCLVTCFTLRHLTLSRMYQSKTTRTIAARSAVDSWRQSATGNVIYLFKSLIINSDSIIRICHTFGS